MSVFIKPFPAFAATTCARGAVAAGFLAAMLGAAPALAQSSVDTSTTGFYVQGGDSIGSRRDTTVLYAGVMVPWDRGEPQSGVTRYWDLFVGQWHGRQANGLDRSFSQLGAAFIWRKRFDDNRSAWFGEGGLGVSYLDGDYSIPDGRILGSRFTFNGRLGIGRNFGAQSEHELSLNYQHFSNGGIKKPNPGIDLIQARYAYRF